MTADLRGQLEAALESRFAIERELGGGGMARVFLALERQLGRHVVLKVLSPELASSVSAERFEREIRTAAQLQDPRIVPLLGAGDAGGLPFYTMPFVEGESLRARLDRGAVPLDEAVAILRDIALALEYAHAHGFVHRDIKPENVLLSRRTAMVTDFGIARAVAAGQADGRTGGRETALTEIGMSIGTPAYMAPEQATGDAVDHRADIYAWGVVAYELLAGAHPFAGRPTARAMVAAHITDPPPPLAERSPAVPRPIANVVERALAKSPADRPRDAAELLRAMDDTGATAAIPRVARSRRLPVAIALVALVAAGALLARRAAMPRTAPGGAEAGSRSLAVIPFVNRSGDTTDAYLAQGIADELTTALAKVPGLRVAGRSSAFRYQGGAVPIAQVARELGVGSVLEGTVRRSGERLRVSAQLTNGADGIVLWADRYDRQVKDVFDVQDEIADAIARAMSGALDRRARVAEAPRGTADLGAYDLFLKGRFFWAKRGKAGLHEAIRYFGDAVRRDSTFARGYAGLAMAYVVLPVFDPDVSADSALPLAELSAARALTLDSTLADAHLALAYVRKSRWRWAEAERHFRSALALAPEDAAVRHWYGVHLYAVGRADESAKELARAAELDPFSTALAADRAIALYASRRFDEARRVIQQAWELDTTKNDMPFIAGLVQLALGQPDSALRSFLEAHRLGSGIDQRPYMVAAYSRLGRRREADSVYAELQRADFAGRALPYDLAVAAAAMGDRARALAALERAVEQRHMFVTEVSLPCDPLFDSLSPDPRFGELLRGAGMRVCDAARVTAGQPR